MIVVIFYSYEFGNEDYHLFGLFDNLALAREAVMKVYPHMEIVTDDNEKPDIRIIELYGHRHKSAIGDGSYLSVPMIGFYEVRMNASTSDKR